MEQALETTQETGRGAGLGGRTALALFASVLFLILVHAAPPGLGGIRFARLARAIVREHTLVLDRHEGNVSPSISGNDDLVVQGRVFLNTNPGHAFLLVPGEVVSHALRPGKDDARELLLQLLLVPMPLSALAVVALAEVAARATGSRSAGLLAAAIFLFGTPFAVYSGCHCQNGSLTALLVLSLAAYVVPGWNVVARAALAGAFGGAAFLVDFGGPPFTLVLGLHVLRTGGLRAALAYSAGWALVASALLPYDAACFGSPLAFPNGVFVEAWRNSPATTLVPPGPQVVSAQGIAYTFFSWRGGILPFCPFVVPAAIEAVRRIRARERGRELALVLLGILCTGVAYEIVNASWLHLEVLENAIFGPRYQLWGLAPAAILFVQRAPSLFGWACAAWSLAVCGSGVMYPPAVPSGCGWRFYMSPVLFLVSGPRAPLASALPSGATWWGYDTHAPSGLGFELLAIGVVLYWIRRGLDEAAREASAR